MRKPPLLFALPRSGSTLFYVLLGAYLRRERGMVPLGEMFNVSKNVIRETENGLAYEYVDSPGVPEPVGEERNRLIRARIKLLEKTPEKYFIKVMATQLSSEVIETLSSSHEWIFVERRNLFEQLLSFSISMLTGDWYKPDGLQVKKGSLTFHPDLLKDFEWLHFQFQQLKRVIKPAHVLVYEDYLTEGSPAKLYASLGWDDSTKGAGIPLPAKQNTSSKLECFSNKDFLVETYAKSCLNNFHEIHF